MMARLPDPRAEGAARASRASAPADVSIAMRCLPSQVRRIRLAAGRDAEDGNPLTVGRANGSPTAFGAELLQAGYSVRAAAMIVGVPKITLADRVRRERC